MPGKPLTRHRTRRRFRVSFRRAEACAFWRLGFRQFSFHHIARVSRCAVPDTWTRPSVSWHALVPDNLSASGKPLDPRTFLQSFPAEPGIRRSASRRTGFAPTRRGMRVRAGCVSRQAKVIAHQLSHTPRVDSIFNVPAGKVNICAGVYITSVVSDRNSALQFNSGNAERLLGAACVSLSHKRREGLFDPYMRLDAPSRRGTDAAVAGPACYRGRARVAGVK
jgi:hypothetical protein